ncbi:uncharacterized protein LOC102716964 [Oryza brachyantha]|uniref:uncharacterized protein LOC102716964 n=1 Tax=Oryza brachyantha TaxID=4533 RepID=UPI001ADD3437|nr:uncharacterized protein LOC102716964 [Oryza brachyantha]
MTTADAVTAREFAYAVAFAGAGGRTVEAWVQHADETANLALLAFVPDRSCPAALQPRSPAHHEGARPGKIGFPAQYSPNPREIITTPVERRLQNARNRLNRWRSPPSSTSAGAPPPPSTSAGAGEGTSLYNSTGAVVSLQLRRQRHQQVRKMLTPEHLTTKRKQTGEDTRCSIENQNGCEKGDLIPGSICSDIVSEAGSGNRSKSGNSSSSELNQYLFRVILHQCVVSLASFIGTMLFSCTGMFIPPESDDDPTSILTSASLIRSSVDESKILDNLTIKVRLQNHLVVIGWLDHYDLKHDLAVVNIECLRPFRAATIDSRSQLQSESNIKAVAVGRCFNSGMLTTTSVMEISRLRDELDMAFLGGPVLGSKCGRIAGISCHGGKMAVLLPLDKVIECLKRTGSTKGGHGTKTPKFAKNHNFYDPCPRRGGF